MMNVRYATNPRDFAAYGTQDIRNSFLISDLFNPGQLNLTYSHYDRIIIGGTSPMVDPITLDSFDALKTAFFLERREIGIVNIGHRGVVRVDGTDYDFADMDPVNGSELR